MIDPCRYCQSEKVAAVLDKRIEKSPTAGNKYRQRCLECERWLPCCSAADFQTADHQHVLPADVDADDPDPTVPVAEFSGPVDGVKGGTPTAVTDGGQDTDDSDVEDDESESNEFDCPGCGGHVEGFPEYCPHDDCGVPYDWEDSDT